MLRTIILAASLALPTALAAAPAAAQGGLEASYAAAPEAPITIADISIGEPLMDKADEYGQREFSRLTAWLREDLESELAEAGWLSDGMSEGSVLRVTIVDATPNRPTMRQSSMGGLHPSSYGIGGAELEAVLMTSEGAPVANFSYSYRTPNIEQASYGTTWTDARRTFDRFSRRLADDLQDHASQGW